MNAPWWLAKVRAAWKRKQLARGLRGPQFGTEAAMEDFCGRNRKAREAKVEEVRREAFGEVTQEREAELRQELIDAHAGKGRLI